MFRNGPAMEDANIIKPDRDIQQNNVEIESVLLMLTINYKRHAMHTEAVTS